MNCLYCGKEVVDGVIRDGAVYCSKKHADLDWRERRADMFAFNQTGGQLTNFEDYMRHEYDATIVDDIEIVTRED